MELRQLHYFATVAAELSFSRAAEQLHIVQPGVSQQISRLERELGVPLFHRTTRQVRLTPAGERLLPEARAALDAAERVRQLAVELAAGTEPAALRIGTSQGLGDRLDRILEAAGVPVRLTARPLHDRLAAVRSGELDAAFVRVLTGAPGLDLLPLWTDPLVAALPAAHPLAAQPALTPEQLSALPVRLAPAEQNRPLHDLLTAAGVGRLRAAPFTTVQDTLAEIGSGPPTWTVLYAAVADLTPVRRVAFRPLTAPTPTTSLAVRPGHRPPGLRDFLAACRSAGG
ncbi:LysR family transcriptional regulator [Actinacidiphila bryophytorum]|uniref:DNA-binding transcriptional regulator, LysR family n=1 Tax=Actinacidiphila bryophytorum TaxID=1436133 RepID=A0A9W4H3D3_9ACTN|nr:LysR family transcriptional regulator [Actinacidiphila bryophytorum]MBM9440910.1 LysR family transcriptional regulator [Actinacidiphila bryophytorum]MBN6542626.1 LysR family transcriptional regulator [Actinacidiphila bryophytorum]CAG7647057.1 DNA-binding transcriptional regulator, LysR family [Actinacidiphila bryophytorum]